MDKMLKGRSNSYFNIKGLWVFFAIVMLLLINAATVFGAPFLEEPGKMSVFFSWDLMGDGSFGDNSYQSFSGASCGIAYPVGYATVGFKTTFDTSKGYWELFSDFNSNETLLTNISLLHTKDKSDHGVSILRVAAFRPMMMDSEGFDLLVGPGLGIITSSDGTNLSMFLEGKSKMYFMEDGFFYANGLIDFMYKSTGIELGVGFNY